MFALKGFTIKTEPASSLSRRPASTVGPGRTRACTTRRRRSRASCRANSPSATSASAAQGASTMSEQLTFARVLEDAAEARRAPATHALDQHRDRVQTWFDELSETDKEQLSEWLTVSSSTRASHSRPRLATTALACGEWKMTRAHCPTDGGADFARNYWASLLGASPAPSVAGDRALLGFARRSRCRLRPSGLDPFCNPILAVKLQTAAPNFRCRGSS